MEREADTTTTTGSLPSNDDGEHGALFPMRFLGLALWVVWDWAVHSPSEAFTGHDAGAGLVMGIDPLLGSIAFCAALVAFAAAHGRIGELASRKALAGFCYVLLLAATALVALRSNGMAAGEALRVAAALAAGVGSAGLALLWAEAYSGLGAGRVFLYGALSFVLAAGAVLFVRHLDGSGRVLAMALVALASYPLAWMSAAFAGWRRRAGRPDERPDFPVKAVAVMSVAGFLAGFVSFALFDSGGDMRVPAVAAVGLLVLVLLAVRRKPLKPILLIDLAFVSLAASFIVVAFLEGAGRDVAALLMMTGYVAISFFVLATLAQTARERDVSPLWLFGPALAARDLASHVGGSLDALLQVRAVLAQTGMHVAVVAVAGLVVLGMTFALWLSERPSRAAWTVSAPRRSADAAGLSPHELLVAQRDAAAAEFGLTEREGDVLLALLEGSTYRDMCQDLFLSMNTVKTHVHHTYVKLGVHTREEAAEKVQSISA